MPLGLCDCVNSVACTPVTRAYKIRAKYVKRTTRYEEFPGPCTPGRLPRPPVDVTVTQGECMQTVHDHKTRPECIQQTEHHQSTGVQSPRLPRQRFIMSGSSCDTNATGAARHEALIASLAAHGAPSASRNVLVLNTIDQHYITLIAAWVDMVRRVILLSRLEACSRQRTRPVL